MSRSLVLRPEARKEFDEAVDDYESRHLGLGADFIQQVQAIFNRVIEMPEGFERVFQDVHRAVVHRFPYLIFYRIEPLQIVVLAVFHGHRDPKIWKERALRSD